MESLLLRHNHHLESLLWVNVVLGQEGLWQVGRCVANGVNRLVCTRQS